METENVKVRPEVMTVDDVMALIPQTAGRPKLAERLIRLIGMDDMNRVHAKACAVPGPECARRIIDDSLGITLKIDNEEVLDNLPEGPFITVSNHPFGALDGVALIDIVGARRPEFKVMVNMILNYVSGLRPNFIAVDPLAQNDPAKRAVSVRGITECIRQLKNGKPMGFFPAGAMSKTNWKGELIDRPWQDSVLRIIHRAKVPVVPIYFQGSNSRLFNFMGHICWPLRSLMLPREIMRKSGKTIHITVGQPISVEEQAPHASTPETLGLYLREKTYALRRK